MNKTVVDAHCDTLGRLVDEGCDVAQLRGGHIDLGRLRSAPVALQFFAVFVHPSWGADRGLRRALLMIQAFHAMCARHREAIRPVLSAGDLAADGRTGALLTLEGCTILEGDLDLMDLLASLGVRSASLTWNERNLLADGAGDQGSGGGLSNLGRQAIGRLEGAHILPDVSHLSRRAVDDVLEEASGPVIASHSCAAAVWDHQRNLPDRQLSAIAATGGVVGLTFYAPFLTGSERAEKEDLFRHLDHLIGAAGEDGVGFGSDFDGMDAPCEGLEDVCGYAGLLGELERRYGDRIAAKIAGGNFLRVLQKTLPQG